MDDWLAKLIERLNDISVDQIPQGNLDVVEKLDEIIDELQDRLESN